MVDSATGKVLDDAQGYGYKSVQNAYVGYGYKNRDKSKDAKKLGKHRAVHKFCKEHKDFIDAIEQSIFEIAKGSWGPDATVNAAFIRQCFAEGGYDLKECGFTAAEFLRYWDKKLPKTKRKQNKKKGNLNHERVFETIRQNQE